MRFFLFKSSKQKSKKSLETLVASKANELDKEINIDPSNKKKLIQCYLLKLSLYFIEENNFINEDYFFLIENELHKTFYELFINPSEEKFGDFIKSFENLNYGADDIFLICEKFSLTMKFMAVDMFFRIVIEKYFYSLNELFTFPINQNRKMLKY